MSRSVSTLRWFAAAFVAAIPIALALLSVGGPNVTPAVALTPLPATPSPTPFPPGYPHVRSIDKHVGAPGDVVTVKVFWNGYSGTTPPTVYFGPQAAEVVESGETIKVLVPSGVPGTKVDVTFNAGGHLAIPDTATADDFTYEGTVPTPTPTPTPTPSPTPTIVADPAPPSLSNVAPQRGRAGDRISVYQQSNGFVWFSYDRRICFGTVPTGSYASETGPSGRIELVVPEGVPGSTVDVHVGCRSDRDERSDNEFTYESGPSTPTPSLPPSSSPTPVPGTPYSYSLSGSSRLRTLTTGTVPLRGALDLAIDQANGTGRTTGELQLDPARARLVALGLIPVTATVQFVPSGPVSGEFVSGTLALSSLVKLRLPQLYLFGAIPIGGGSCQTRRLTELSLSASSFDPEVGGTLSDSYAISDLTGCGALNGLISPLTAGAGNTISLTLTPKPAASS